MRNVELEQGLWNVWPSEAPRMSSIGQHFAGFLASSLLSLRINTCSQQKELLNAKPWRGNSSRPCFLEFLMTSCAAVQWMFLIGEYTETNAKNHVFS